VQDLGFAVVAHKGRGLIILHCRKEIPTFGNNFYTSLKNEPMERIEEILRNRDIEQYIFR
jgi:hypothetical protein